MKHIFPAVIENHRYSSSSSVYIIFVHKQVRLHPTKTSLLQPVSFCNVNMLSLRAMGQGPFMTMSAAPQNLPKLLLLL